MSEPPTTSSGLTRGEILGLVNRYIGVIGGYLGDFSYRTHGDFYAEYCGLDLDPFDYLEHGTTRDRFIVVLEQVSPFDQARILRGVLAKYPPGSSDLRTEANAAELVVIAERLERGGMVASSPTYTSDVVRRALDDAEALLRTSGAISAVDRVHTSLHGHLLYLCGQAGIACERGDTMVVLLKKLRREHPGFQDLGPRSNDVQRVLNSSGNILDSLNPVRNNASVAHPNDQLLDPPEAGLMINIARSVLMYLDEKTNR